MVFPIIALASLSKLGQIITATIASVSAAVGAAAATTALGEMLGMAMVESLPDKIGVSNF